MTQIQRTIIRDNKVTDIFVEPGTAKDFGHYKVELEHGFGGCYAVRYIDKCMFVASLRILGEYEIEIVRLIETE